MGFFNQVKLVTALSSACLGLSKTEPSLAASPEKEVVSAAAQPLIPPQQLSESERQSEAVKIICTQFSTRQEREPSPSREFVNALAATFQLSREAIAHAECSFEGVGTNRIIQVDLCDGTRTIAEVRVRPSDAQLLAWIPPLEATRLYRAYEARLLAFVEEHAAQWKTIQRLGLAALPKDDQIKFALSFAQVFETRTGKVRYDLGAPIPQIDGTVFYQQGNVQLSNDRFTVKVSFLFAPNGAIEGVTVAPLHSLHQIEQSDEPSRRALPAPKIRHSPLAPITPFDEDDSAVA